MASPDVEVPTSSDAMHTPVKSINNDDTPTDDSQLSGEKPRGITRTITASVPLVGNGPTIGGIAVPLVDRDGTSIIEVPASGNVFFVAGPWIFKALSTTVSTTKWHKVPFKRART